MKLFVTAQATDDRLREVPLPQTAGMDGAVITLGPDKQTLLGFGGAFTESAAYTFYRMSEKRQEEILDLYFNPVTGSGYTLGRMAISSSDFAQEVYDYISPGDAALDTFSMRREEDWVIPLIKRASEKIGAPVTLLASPWSPPAFMKTNGDKLHGGHLLAEYADNWAAHFIKFIQTARAYGLHIEWISVQNEPEALQTWDSCLYTAEEERDFVKNHLSPALRTAGITDVGILVHDHNRDNLLPRVLPIYADEEAASCIWGAAVHWYVSEDFAACGKLHDARPDKHMLFTEGCQEGGPHPGAWHTGERYARNIMGDLNHYVEGWIDWNLVLDETGGPNHVGNFCDAAILCDTRTDELIINSSYYYITHFSKFIRPGAVRLESSITSETLKTLAARNPDGSVALVVLNETDEPQSFQAELMGRKIAYTLPPHSIATVIAE